MEFTLPYILPLLQRCGKSISVNAGKQFGDCQFICQALVTVDLNLPVEDGTKPFAVLFFTFVWFRPRV
ncbi:MULTISPECIES: hypothetical protein [Agrobacterium]|jgi:hypothetical protein|uniref:Uncharacterized protein n=2 Tax=Agrobacterium tumefaciens complex TaxID=1183400 RepID=A0A2Z2PGB7_9HYPH|nr:hypothetical protein [Agrobacterium sp.]ASK40763.1 hypothetical protein [Agrobacterium genomosp. 6]ASK41873.1 hypothetical protein [Agrobacterium fabrum]KEY51327.1 hypothetical protein EN41_06425 [Agrobacterium tumefaciens]ASK42552.1 hypothetical protein [Agrobacterium sp.]UVY99530.1 hypothetical protein K4M20_00257 [Agrobacterium fabrum]